MRRATLALLLCAGAMAAPPRKGILKGRIYYDKQWLGEPGQVVIYTPSGVTVDGRTVPGDWGYNVMPFDAEFVPSRVYLMLTAEEWPEETRCALARAAVEYFPGHRLYDEIFLTHVKCVERAAPEDKSPPAAARKLIEDYLKRHPDGKLRDRFEWQLVQWDNYVYEYEGEAEFPIKEARAYERFLAAHPQSAVVDDIRLKLGWLYRVIHECLDKPGKPERAWKEKARQMYAQLLDSRDAAAREKARVAIYNLEHGRRVYAGANEW